MDSLKNKVILITGSAIRIGRAIALSLYDAKLILHYNESEKEAHSLKRELSEKGCKCKLFKADFNNPKEIKHLFEFIRKEYGHLDILVNSAATFDKSPFLEIEDFDSVFNINLKAPLIASQQAAKIMKEGSLIINICDPTSKVPFKHHLLHGISKAALSYATKALALELSPKIRVNNLLIGVALPSIDYTKEAIELVIEKHTLVQRVAKLSEIVKGIHFLIENEYVNATTIEVDGGWV
jgi:enoyl-[acyl-carrier protein] reductase III